MTKISSALPHDDGNGLDRIAGALVRNPAQLHVVVALVDCMRITTETDTGQVVPTARVRHIEVIDADDTPAAVEIMRRALDDRVPAPDDLDRPQWLRDALDVLGGDEPDSGEAD